jgi:hypothetical protein
MTTMGIVDHVALADRLTTPELLPQNTLLLSGMSDEQNCKEPNDQL